MKTLETKASRDPARARIISVLVALALLVGCATDSGSSGAGDASAEDSSADDSSADDSGGANGATDEAHSRDLSTSAAIASPGCETAGGGAAAGEVDVPRTVSVDGDDRSYLLTVPDDSGSGSGSKEVGPRPVVFDFHGLMEGSEIHSRMTGYSALATEEGFVAVLPEGAGDPLHWELGADGTANPDLRFFDAMLDQIAAEACIDMTRIYATGLSNGAMFTTLLACERSEVIAAAVPVAGLADLPGCTYERPVPMLTFHGTADPILLFNGGVDTSAIPGMDGEATAGTTNDTPEADIDGEGYPDTARTFAERNGCDPEPTDTPLTDEVLHRVYDCPRGAEVEFYIVLGGGHSWPSSEFSESIGNIVGPTTFDVDATRDGWDFLSSHRLS